MEKRNFFGKDISLLGFGSMRFPVADEKTQEIDYAETERMIDFAIENGVNYFDSGWLYQGGNSERVLGSVLSKYPRDRYFLATKVPTWAIMKRPEQVDEIFFDQLEKLKVDHIDFYLAHCLTNDFFERFQSLNMYDSLMKKKQQGLIKHLGFSFHDETAVMRRILNAYDWDFAQIQLNYIDWDSLDSKGQYELLSERNLPVVVMEPVRGGALASLNKQAISILQSEKPEASAASWAIRYAASLPNVMTVLSGMSALEQVRDNVATMQNFAPLTPREYDVLDQAAQAYKASAGIPCTGCRYCMDCPSGVNIPRVFSVYNHYKASGDIIQFRNHYRSLSSEETVEHCVACGLCSENCPQNIDIPARIKEISDFIYLENKDMNFKK
jgi:predicted aldo/keto reductase-like oxidoreductase